MGSRVRVGIRGHDATTALRTLFPICAPPGIQGKKKGGGRMVLRNPELNSPPRTLLTVHPFLKGSLIARPQQPDPSDPDLRQTPDHCATDSLNPQDFRNSTEGKEFPMEF
mmetsp:Transcript_32281/g.50322  ORF Transcript_32281/g.50322 Transcript_32281/m.50322 type:complete len:110 (+) Transcript_32281:1714-2043(+)